MYFDTKNRTVYSPKNSILEDLYKVLKKYAPVLGDSRIFDDLVDVYETLDFDLKEENE